MIRPFVHVLALLMTMTAGSALAQTYPQKPVRVIVAFAPGTTSDIIGNSPEAADRFLKSELARWGAVVRAANVKAN